MTAKRNPEDAPPSRQVRALRAAGAYGALGLMVVAVLVLAYSLTEAEPGVPLYYRVGSDLNIMMTLIKSVSESGGYLTNDRLGAPDGMNLFDFPAIDNGFFLVVRLLSLAVGDPLVLYNVSFLSTFVLVAWSSLFAARRLGLGPVSSTALSLLFAFAPYHFWRGPWHMLLSAYYSVPLAILLSLWICGGEPIFFERVGPGRLRPRWVVGQSGPGLFCAAVIALGNGYHVAFGAYFVAASGLIALARRRFASALDALVIAGLILGAFVAQLTPVFAFQSRNGDNLLVSRRTVEDTRGLALRVSEMLAPMTGHRLAGPYIPVFPKDMDGRPRTPLLSALGIPEAQLSSPLGVMGSCGLVILLATGLGLGARRGVTAGLVGDLGKLTYASLVLALRGGLCEVIAGQVNPIIRGYNRMSIYIDFMSLLALALLADAARRHFGWNRVWYGLAVSGVVVLGLLDQTPVLTVPIHRADAAAFKHDQAFFREVEAAVAPESRIFQLPFSSFPGSRVHQMPEFDHFRAYLNTRRLRWSYGAASGRKPADEQSRLASLPPVEMSQALVDAGFAGVYLNRAGFPDPREADLLVDVLSKKGGARPIRSGDGQMVYVSLTPGAQRNPPGHLP